METESPHFDPLIDRKLTVRLLQAVNRVVCRCYHRLTVLSPSQLPARGAAILISNHTSGLDPFMLQSMSKRALVWMMAKEYYEIPPFKPMFKAIEAIPVDRGSRDTTSLRLALRALKEGHIVGIFPEGRISPTRGQLLPFQPGVAQMAIKTGVPVYPAYLDGTQCGVTSMISAFLHRQETTVRFGPPVEFDRTDTRHETLRRATEAMQQAVEGLRDA